LHSEGWRVFTTKLEPILLKISDDILPAPPEGGAGAEKSFIVAYLYDEVRTYFVENS